MIPAKHQHSNIRILTLACVAKLCCTLYTAANIDVQSSCHSLSNVILKF